MVGSLPLIREAHTVADDDIPSGDLMSVLNAVFAEAAPELFGGASPPMSLRVSSQELTVLSSPREDGNGPLRTTGSETITLDVDHPLGPYDLSVTPSPGTRSVRLKSNGSLSASLGPDEVVWDVGSTRTFRLEPRRYRSLDHVTDIQITYPTTT